MPKPAKTLSDDDYRALAEFRYLLRQFLAFSEMAAAKENLSTQQHQALLAIKGFGGKLTVGELAERLLIKPHSAAELADRLEFSGLIRKKTDENDRRKIWICPTAAAEKRLRSLSHAHKDELARLSPLLKTLLGNWEGHARQKVP